jgi:hypothetical protein
MITLPLVVAILGALGYAFFTKYPVSVLAEICRIMFAMGLLVTLFGLSGRLL